MSETTEYQIEQEAQEAWLAYRDSHVAGHRSRTQLRRRDFIAGFLAGRTPQNGATS